MLPNGTEEDSNELGWAYYDKLIDALLAENIQPMVTLYHWDLPQALQDIGGWENRAIIQHFLNYAKMCYERYGDRVSPLRKDFVILQLYWWLFSSTKYRS